jgi:iron complex outermembrane recepter protein
MAMTKFAKYSVSLLALAWSGLSSAQTEVSADEPADIVVTGSRVARPNLEGNSPVTVLSGDRLQTSAETNIVRQLQELPAFSPGRSPSGGEQSSFTGSFVDLRGLGRARTLTLVDGRRWINTISDGGVDYSTIPPELIERVEIVTGGASATYGSDAVAGVVNIILKRKIEGIELNAQTGITDRGEATNTRISVTTGGSFASEKGQFYIHGSYDRTELIRANGRNFLDPAVINSGGQLVPFSFSDLIPSGSALVNGTSSPFRNGELFSAPNVANLTSNTEKFNAGRFARVQIGAKKYTAAAGFEYEVNDWAKLYGQGIFVREETFVPRAPDGRDLSGIAIPVANPFLGPLTRAYLTSLDTDADGFVTIDGLSRRFSELGVRARTNDRDSYRFLAGATFDLWQGWSLDANVVFSASNFSIRTQGDIDNQRLAQALDVVAGPSGPECRIATSDGLRCAPLNIFGVGTITAEAASFISTEGGLDGYNRDTNFQAIATGPLFDLPAGPLGVAFGIEHRNSRAEESPNEVWLTGSSSDQLAFFQAGLKQTEFFAEARVPILKDVPFAQYLGLELGGRYTTFSPGSNAWTYKLLGEWAPTDFLRFRGGLQRATRAPNPFELGGGDQLFTSLGALGSDPCFTGAPLTGDLRASCIANGVPAAIATVGGAASPTQIVRATFFGNPNLEPEIAKTWTVGAVLNNFGLGNLSLTVDYYKIDLQGAISSAGRDVIFGECNNSGTGGSSPFCSEISRDPATGLLRSIDDGPLNLGSFKVNGIDFGLNYSRPVSLFGLDEGQIGVNFVATYLFDFNIRSFRDDPTSEFGCAGRYGSSCGDPRPRVKTNTQFFLKQGPVTTSLNWNWIGKVNDSAPEIDPGIVPNLARLGIGSKHYFDLNMVWDINERFQFRAGVDNMFDTAAPRVGVDRTTAAADNSTFPGLYDAVGRRFFVGGKVKF